MPFGALQFIIIISASYATTKLRIKSAILLALVVPVIAGLAVLYAIPHTKANVGPLLAGYYLLAFLFGGNPVLISWIVGNTAGTTKKSAIMSAFNAGSAVGNIVGPLIFNSATAPTYHPGLQTVLGIFIALAACTVIQAAYLMFLNKSQERRRVRNGKPAKIIDHSMETHYHDAAEQVDSDMAITEGDAEIAHGHQKVGENAFLDMTDRQNDEFVYIY